MLLKSLKKQQLRRKNSFNHGWLESCPFCRERNLTKFSKVSANSRYIERDIMRIDKFLKVSRIIKRRTIAKEACDGGRININGKVAKAGSDVKIGDNVSIRFGDKLLEFKVLDIKENPRKEEAASMYEEIARVNMD